MRVDIRVLAICACLVLVGRPAFAHSWWTWLDELSGPGGFRAPVLFGMEIWCVGTLDEDTNTQLNKIMAGRAITQAELDALREEAKRVRKCSADRTNVITTVSGEFAGWNDKQDPTRYTGDTRLKSFLVIAYSPVFRPFSERGNFLTRSVDVGTGFGAYHLTGTTIADASGEYWRAVIPVRLRIIPSELIGAPGLKNKKKLRKFLQAIQYRFGYDFVPGTIVSTSFNNFPTRQTEREWIETKGVQVDVGTLIWSRSQRK